MALDKFLRSSIGVGFLTLLITFSLTQPQPVLATTTSSTAYNRVLVLLQDDAQIHDINSTIHSFEMAGGHIIHIFTPSAFIADVPAGASIPSHVLVYDHSIDIDTLNNLPDAAQHAAHIWNTLLEPTPPAGTSDPPNAPELAHELSHSAMVPPPPAHRLQSITSSDPTPGYAETSEFFIGRVAVGIVLPESDGSIDPSTEDWSAEERALVVSEITTALDWWAAQEPSANLTFVYDDGTTAPIPTSYEPISRKYGDQSLWIKQIMGEKGYTESSYFDRVRSYNNDLRQTHGTDWAFTIFVVDSANDADNRFADGYFAYAYIGGPFMVMTYGNNGYGPSNMDAVAAHEVGHIFHALDQYSSAQQPCTRRSGYLGVENQNSQYGDCLSDQPSIMRGQVVPYTNEAIDAYAQGQVGWRDSDGDGILDPVDTTISLSSAQIITGDAASNVLTATGSLRDEPFFSPLRRSVTINTITSIQYRIGDDTWTNVPAADGALDSYSEDFTFTTPSLPTGEVEIVLRAMDSAGNRMTQTLTTVSVVNPVDEILDTTLTRLARQGGDAEMTTMTYNGQSRSEISYVAGMYYRVDDDAWQTLAPDDGAFDEPQEDFTLAIDLTTLQPGEHRIQAYAIDGEGNVEPSPASDFVTVAPQTSYVFLPLVMAHPQPDRAPTKDVP